jgi:Tfp pilus assembly protein PilN
MGKDYIVTDCIEHPEKNRCVDIIQQRDGKYRFQEWRRDSEDMTGWILLLDSQPALLDNEYAARRAAEHAIDWLNKQ